MSRGLLGRLRESWLGFRSLLTFLTIIPAGGDFNYAPTHFYWAPLIGLIEGLLATPPLLISKPIGAALATALTLIVNGFQHMDGFLDFGEVLLTGRRGEEALRVLKDPHRGSFALALGLVNILVTYASILSMGKWAIVILPITQTTAAYTMYVAAYLGKPGEVGFGRLFVAGSKGLGKLTSSTVIYLASITAVLLLGDLSLVRLLVLMLLNSALSLLLSLLTVKLSHSRLGFVNGDVLGFSFELSKVTLLTLYSILLTLTGLIPH